MANGNTCEMCGELFEAKRSDARFCSASCRSKAARARKSGGDAVAAPVRKAAVATPMRNAAGAAAAPTPDMSALVELRAELIERLVLLDERIGDVEGDQAEARMQAQVVSEYGRRLVAVERRGRGSGPDEATVKKWIRAAMRDEVQVLRDESSDRGEELRALRETMTNMERRPRPDRRSVDRAPGEKVEEIDEALRMVIRRLDTVEVEQGKLMFSVMVLERMAGVE